MFTVPRFVFKFITSFPFEFKRTSKRQETIYTQSVREKDEKIGMGIMEIYLLRKKRKTYSNRYAENSGIGPPRF